MQVTGPSLTSDTAIISWKRPCSTSSLPCDDIMISINVSYSVRASTAAAAREKDGLGLRQSACNVNCDTQRIGKPRDDADAPHARPSAPSQRRHARTRDTSHSASRVVSPRSIPISATSPAPIAPNDSPPAVATTEADVTRCNNARIQRRVLFGRALNAVTSSGSSS